GLAPPDPGAHAAVPRARRTAAGGGLPDDPGGGGGDGPRDPELPAGRRSEHQPLHGRARREPRGAARARGLPGGVRVRHAEPGDPADPPPLLVDGGDERGLDPDAHRARLRPLRIHRQPPAGVSRAPVLQAPAPVERWLVLAGTYEVDSGRSGFMCFASRITRADGSGRKSHPFTYLPDRSHLGRADNVRRHPRPLVGVGWSAARPRWVARRADL